MLRIPPAQKSLKKPIIYHNERYWGIFWTKKSADWTISWKGDKAERVTGLERTSRCNYYPTCATWKRMSSCWDDPVLLKRRYLKEDVIALQPEEVLPVVCYVQHGGLGKGRQLGQARGAGSGKQDSQVWWLNPFLQPSAFLFSQGAGLQGFQKFIFVAHFPSRAEHDALERSDVRPRHSDAAGSGVYVTDAGAFWPENALNRLSFPPLLYFFWAVLFTMCIFEVLNSKGKSTGGCNRIAKLSHIDKNPATYIGGAVNSSIAQTQPLWMVQPTRTLIKFSHYGRYSPPGYWLNQATMDGRL